MPQGSSSEQDPDDAHAEFVEIDPTGRYGRYKDVLGKGAFKKVYRGFDEVEGIEVAWNQIKVADLLRDSEDLERLYSEVHLLKTLKHKNIIKFYYSWVDTKHEHINFITEIFTSGTLRQYRKKHKHIDLRALKKWSRQILEGLSYLHNHDPQVIHRDLKCDNIFVNGNQGEVKIGDLGLATIIRQTHSAHSVIGTPEFMAPELYEEEYNELVDIYAFGMCLLELVTFEYPYLECANAAQIFKKVTSGIKPASLARVADPGVREFIEKCITHVSKRLSAKELLMDPFLRLVDDSESVGRTLHSIPHHLDHGDDNITDHSLSDTSRDFVMQSERKDNQTIFLKLRIADSTGHFRNIHFPFDVQADTTVSVAREMVEELNLTDQDVFSIAEIIEAEIRSNVPDWTPGQISGENFGEVAIPDTSDSETKDDASTLTPSSYVLERFSSGRKYWSDSQKVILENFPNKHGPSNVTSLQSLETDGHRLVKDNKQFPNIIKEEDTQDGAASLEEMDDDYVYDHVKEEENEPGVLADSQFDNGRRMTADLHVAPSLEGKDRISSSVESKDVSAIAEKIGHLLLNQQKELDELKRRHELAISDFLDELPPEIRLEVLHSCKFKIPDYKLHFL